MEQTQPKVSVIVPVYNVEKYVGECLESILNQTLKDIEIIVLNDGSTDGSLKIIKKYAEQDSRILVYSHENRGLGPTRNRGITLAKGEYLAFVDSDDTIVPDALETLYSRAVEQGADVVEGEVMLLYEDDPSKNRVRTNLSDLKYIQVTEDSKDEFYRTYYFPRIISHNACDKLYSIKLVTDNHIIFGDNRRIFAEDNWFQLQVFLALPRISVVNKVVYNYRQQTNSIMHRPKKNLLERHSNMVRDYTELLEMHGNQLADRRLRALLAFDVLIMELWNQRNCNGSRRMFIKALSGIQKNKLMKECIIDIVKIGAYRLESKHSKVVALVVISVLYRINLIDLAHSILWRLYRN